MNLDSAIFLLNFASLVFYLSEKVFSMIAFNFRSSINNTNHFSSSQLSPFSFLCSYLVTHIALTFFYSNSIQNLKIGVCN